jgi:hypothetical protein
MKPLFVKSQSEFCGTAVKAILPEPQCPVAETSRSSVARLYTDAIRSHEFGFVRGTP